MRSHTKPLWLISPRWYCDWLPHRLCLATKDLCLHSELLRIIILHIDLLSVNLVYARPLVVTDTSLLISIHIFLTFFIII